MTDLVDDLARGNSSGSCVSYRVRYDFRLRGSEHHRFAVLRDLPGERKTVLGKRVVSVWSGKDLARYRFQGSSGDKALLSNAVRELEGNVARFRTRKHSRRMGNTNRPDVRCPLSIPIESPDPHNTE